MPIYEVQHAIPLSISQKDGLAQAITTIHSQKFTTPKMFVQVTFTDVSESFTYLGGKRRKGNHIRGSVRSGPSRTQEDWNELCEALAEAWKAIAGTPLPTRKGGIPVETDTSLRSCIVVGGMLAGLEAGFVLPKAGDDVKWLQENWEEFQKRADGGDEEMKELVEEVQQRGLLDGSNGLKTAAKQLEEMLGWGDSA